MLILARVPPNCFFEIDDFESTWHFKEPFDFVHGRNLGGTVRDFPRLARRAMNNLKPGGWVEFADFDGVQAHSDDDTITKAPNIQEWYRLQNVGHRKFGKEFDLSRQYKQHLINAGFKNVKEEVFKVLPTPATISTTVVPNLLTLV